jgi:hypothetical protein
MTPDEMLNRLGLKHEQLHDLLEKYRKFTEQLDEHQHAVVKRSLPTLAEARAAFGNDVTAEELKELFEGDKRREPVILCFPLHHRRAI